MDINGNITSFMQGIIKLSEGKESYPKLPQGQKNSRMSSVQPCNISMKLNYHHLQKTIAALQKQLPEKNLEKNSKTYQKLKYSTEFKNQRTKHTKKLKSHKTLLF